MRQYIQVLPVRQGLFSSELFATLKKTRFCSGRNCQFHDKATPLLSFMEQNPFPIKLVF